VEANATKRAVRGNRLPAKLDGIYRAEQRGESHRTRTRAEAVARELLKETFESMMAEGRKELAREVWRFAAEMPPPKTEQELIAEHSLGRVPDVRPRDGRAQNCTIPISV
jgi:hypothetical protein